MSEDRNQKGPQMDFFYCIYGECDKCSKKTSLGCNAKGECCYCLAQNTDFCDTFVQ